jgi:hypothetical protein
MLLASVVSVVADAAKPRSDLTSDAERPSIVVPSTRKKSSFATPEPNVATLPLDIPLDGMSDVSATVPAELGSVMVTSAVDAGPISVTALVPLSVSSLNNIEPAADDEPVRIGAVKLLFASVCVESVVIID